MTFGWIAVAGLAAGMLAGIGARYGRICTMGATEDLIVSGDSRGARLLGFALAVAVVLTYLGEATGTIGLSTSIYRQPQVDFVATALGGLLFGLGMAFVGTCSFGLLVRAGSGDLRAFVAAALVGVMAFAVTGGAFAPLRALLVDHGVVDLTPIGGPSLAALVSASGGDWLAHIVVGGLVLTLLVAVWLAPSHRRGWRPLLGASLIGVAVAAGWATTSASVEAMELTRVESLSFVAPIGRLLLQLMIEPMRGVEFGVGAVLGVPLGSFAVAALRNELRWEAFDDAREMLRHALGASLMALGGVLARGCTIGQGLSAGSTLSVTMPVFVIGLLIGAKLGLDYLLEGRTPWSFMVRSSQQR